MFRQIVMRLQYQDRVGTFYMYVCLWLVIVSGDLLGASLLELPQNILIGSDKVDCLCLLVTETCRSTKGL